MGATLPPKVACVNAAYPCLLSTFIDLPVQALDRRLHAGQNPLRLFYGGQGRAAAAPGRVAWLVGLSSTVPSGRVKVQP